MRLNQAALPPSRTLNQIEPKIACVNDFASRTLRAGSELLASWSASSPPGPGAAWFMRPPLAHEALDREVP